MNRRNFLQALGVSGGVSTLAACGIDDNRYYTPIEQILPYVVRPEQITPGMPTYFATCIGTGPNAYPALAVHREGRVINVGANTRAPADNAIPVSSFMELQRHYSPDRVKQPTADGQAISWEDGQKKLTDAVQAARSGGKKVVYLGAYQTGAFAQLMDGFTGGNNVHWEALGRDAEATAANQLFGSPALPFYNIAKAHYVLSFGAEFLGGSWGGAWSQSAFSHARDRDDGQFVARYSLVAPMRSQSGANADDWYAATPGSEAQVALAVAKLVAEAKHYSGPATKLVAGADVAAAAAAAGIDAAAIEEMAKHFAANPALALPGGVSGQSGSATELAAAVYALNIVSGHNLMTSGGYAGQVSSFADLEALVADMKAGKVGVLLIDDADPVHSLPGGDFAEAMGSVGLTVSVSSHVSETSAICNVTLPSSDVFEDWGHEEPLLGFHIIRQPAMTPLNDTRSLGDVVLATWRAVDAANAPAGSWHDAVKAFALANLFNTPAPAVVEDAVEDAVEVVPVTVEGEVVEEAIVDDGGAAFVTWWAKVLADGAYVSPAYGNKVALALTGGITFAPAVMAGAGELFLHVYEHAHTGDGRFANQPWAQELPDPLTGQVWDSWVLMHPETAKSLGVEDNSLVSLTTDAGTIEIGVEMAPYIRKDVVAVAFGQGRTTASGRYAENCGRNVVDLLAATKGAHGALALQQAKVSAKSAGKPAELVNTFSWEDGDDNRGFAVVANHKDYEKHGDDAQHDGGEFTNMHFPKLDKRLNESGIAGFYPEPDHPTYRFALTVDTDKCTGCGACAVACYAENNLPIVGKQKVREGREMGWIRVNRYLKGDEIHFVPMMCQHCGHAPCESVCPVLATYHTIDGLNAMVYNRCAGTRYCSNACPFSQRKFNYHTYAWPEPFNLQLNPDVVTRTMGVMEKCTFCVQRIRRVKSAYKDAHGFTSVVPEEALGQLVACAEACPSQALTFGNHNNETSTTRTSRKSGRNYFPLEDLNLYPAVNYLAKVSFHVEHAAHGGGHGGAEASHDAPAHEPTENHEPAHKPAGH
ncbi:MAG: 4Fe-4S dicluster domain-containing protein [Rhodobacterales bacterium]|nr:4Fe-4S dicluster domain-containing protein [Rhodobacterales bacterium]